MPYEKVPWGLITHFGNHYLGEVEFDAPEDWHTRIVVRCGTGDGEAEKVVAVTPPGQGPVLDFILYLLPFAAVGSSGH